MFDEEHLDRVVLEAIVKATLLAELILNCDCVYCCDFHQKLCLEKAHVARRRPARPQRSIAAMKGKYIE